jgi:hypothetical protein
MHFCEIRVYGIAACEMRAYEIQAYGDADAGLCRCRPVQMHTYEMYVEDAPMRHPLIRPPNENLPGPLPQTNNPSLCPTLSTRSLETLLVA